MRERINEHEVAVHVLVFDERAAKDNLRNQDERYNVGGGFRIGHERRNEQPKRHAGHRRHQHDAEIDPEHPANLQEIIADQHEKHALGERENAERKRLRDHVIREANVEISLPLQDRPVTDHIVRAVR